MAYPTRVYLTGFMGSGKSTLGPMLANVLGYEFVDLDVAIEAHLGQSISSFFAEQGEAAFRRVESARLEQTAGLEEYVISLGGGALLAAQNRNLIKRAGVVIYLQWSPDRLLERLARSTERPILRDAEGHLLSKEALATKIRTLLMQREPFYREAHIVVPMDGLSVGWSVDAVANALRKWVRHQRRGAM